MAEVRISHDLDAAEVRRRMAARVGDLERLLPGGAGTITHEWQNDDVMGIVIETMGQRIESTATNAPGALVIAFSLPPGVGFIRPVVESVIRKAGDKLLLAGPRDAAGG